MDRVRSFITTINQAVKKSKTKFVSVITPDQSLYNITGARPYTGTGRTSSGAEAYTDVIFDSPNIKEIRVSLKTDISEINGQGDIRTVELILPGVTNKFTKLLLNELINQDYGKGEQLPGLYGELSPLLRERVIIGNQSMGGPLDYVFLGDTKGYYDEERNIVEFSDPLITARIYAKTQSAFLNLRPFREDQTFDPEAQRGGIYQIFGRSPTRGDDIIKIFVVSSVPKGSIVVDVSL
jgi:hypothetical protein